MFTNGPMVVGNRFSDRKLGTIVLGIWREPQDSIPGNVDAAPPYMERQGVFVSQYQQEYQAAAAEDAAREFILSLWRQSPGNARTLLESIWLTFNYHRKMVLIMSAVNKRSKELEAEKGAAFLETVMSTVIPETREHKMTVRDMLVLATTGYDKTSDIMRMQLEYGGKKFDLYDLCKQIGKALAQVGVQIFTSELVVDNPALTTFHIADNSNVADLAYLKMPVQESIRFDFGRSNVDADAIRMSELAPAIEQILRASSTATSLGGLPALLIAVGVAIAAFFKFLWSYGVIKFLLWAIGIVAGLLILGAISVAGYFGVKTVVGALQGMSEVAYYVGLGVAIAAGLSLTVLMFNLATT